MEPGRMRPGSALLRWDRRWLLVLPLITLIVLFLLPLLSILPQAVRWPHVSGAEFRQVFSVPVYVKVLERTVTTSLIVTAATLVIAFPLAWIMSQCGPRLRAGLGLLILVPFLISALVMTFSWIVILGENGLINDVLVGIGIRSTRTSFLFTRFAVVIALIQTSIPFMVLPLLATMRKIDPKIVRVAESLGAPRLSALRRTVVPLSLPAVRVGVTVVFLYSMASFIAPAVLGGPSDTMIGQLIESTINNGLDWGFAAALAIVLVLVCVIVVAVITVVFRRATRWQHPGSHARIPQANSVDTVKHEDRIVAVRTPRSSLGLPAGRACSVPPLRVTSSLWPPMSSDRWS